MCRSREIVTDLSNQCFKFLIRKKHITTITYCTRKLKVQIISNLSYTVVFSFIFVLLFDFDDDSLETLSEVTKELFPRYKKLKYLFVNFITLFFAVATELHLSMKFKTLNGIKLISMYAITLVYGLKILSNVPLSHFPGM